MAIFLEQYLKKLGLSEKEAKIYLAVLELGADSIKNIAQKAKIKRPTAYVIIEELINKGLVSTKPGYRGKAYAAESPETLLGILKEQERTYKEALPFLKDVFSGEKKGKPQVTVYEGLESMKQIYLNTVWKSKTEILFFSSIKQIYAGIPTLLEEWMEYMKKQVNSSKYQQKTKELINPDPVDIKYGLRVSEIAKANTEVKVLPKDYPFKFIGSDNAVFEDKVVMVSYQDRLFTTVIQSQAIADTMRSIYFLAWNSAIPIDEFVKKEERRKKKNKETKKIEK